MSKNVYKVPLGKQSQFLKCFLRDYSNSKGVRWVIIPSTEGLTKWPKTELTLSAMRSLKVFEFDGIISKRDTF